VFKDYQDKNQDLRLHKIIERSEKNQAETMHLLIRREVAELKQDQQEFNKTNLF
jgi:hypothetical protein